MNIKLLTLGGIFGVLALLFQLSPIFLSELFIPLTMFSSIPIYIITRINPRYGFITLVAVSLLAIIINIHEGLFFICTNGPVGFSLGASNYFTNKKWIISFISSIVLTITLSIMTFIIGIPVFGARISGSIFIELFILYLFSYVYSYLYLLFSTYLYKKLKKYITFKF